MYVRLVQFGLSHLLEAAEQCLPVPVASTAASPSLTAQTQQQQTEPSLRKRSFSEHPALYFPQQQQSPLQQQQPMAMPRMPSLAGMFASDDSGRSYKRARPELASMDFPGASYLPQHQFQSLQPPPQHVPTSSRQHLSPRTQAAAFRSPMSYSALSSPGVASSSGSPSSVPMPSLIWETVLASGKFPSDVCLSESSSHVAPALTSSPLSSTTEASDVSSSCGSCAGSPSDANSSDFLKQGRWTPEEKEFAKALIEAVHNGDVVLPPNMSVRKFIAASLKCKAMRVSKKFKSLRANPPATNDELEADDAREKRFNPLSLSSIMNTDGSGSSTGDDECHFSAPVAPAPAASLSGSDKPASAASAAKKAQRVLKRSDYSQHGMVRSGRWSLEEENYAKAMIEAFKAGYLPLHGNVSLRKFLSEVLVCHPMRISKKFVGYVRKYHWYRIAAGKCDPEAKQQALEQLAHLERAFWASMQQSNDWALASASAAALSGANASADE